MEMGEIGITFSREYEQLIWFPYSFDWKIVAENVYTEQTGNILVK